MAPLSSTQACRKYVDLINISSAMYANWDPLRHVEVGQPRNHPRMFDACFLHEVGDIGRIDPETGHFVSEGNIYRDEPLASAARRHLPEVHDPVDEIKIESSISTGMSAPP